MNTAGGASGGTGAPGDRLERALAAFLAAPPTTRADADALLAGNPDLQDLLAPMVDPTTAGGDVPAEERVLGDFRLVRELGRGGMGIVYEAWQRSLDRRVAVKVLAAALVASPAAVARFRREATAAGRMRHPGIVEVFGFGSDGGEHFFAMQFVDGVPLHDAAARFRSPAAAVRLVAALADALVHAHAAGLVHRDVKPANVLVRADDTALLTDFGVARDASLPSLTRDGGFVGTLDYAAPEQVRGEEVDARTDVWALGVILHELLTGEHPFRATTQEATMHRILSADPPSLRGVPGVGDDLAAVADRALEKSRTRRYASAAALLADLRALERGDGVSVRLPTGIERLQRWAGRNRWRAFAAAVLLVGVPALTGVLGYLWANAPLIEAATAAERERDREERLADALFLGQQDDHAAGLARLGPPEPGEDLDHAVVRALLLTSAGDHDGAARALAGHDGKVVELVRGFRQPRTARLDGIAEMPSDPLECFVRAQLVLEKQAMQGTSSRATSARIVDLATKAIALAPRPRLSYFLTLAKGADEANDRAALDTALQALTRHFPDSVVASRVRARTLARHKPDEALALMDRLERDGNGGPRTWLWRGLAHEAANRLDDAIAANRRAAELLPNEHTGWLNLGVTLRKAKRHDESVAAVERAIELGKHRPTTWNALGLSRRDAGDTDGAAAAFRRALELSYDYGAAALNLGNLLMRSKDYAGAKAAFERVLAREPNDVRAVANLGDALGRLGDDEHALACAIRATHLAPNDFIPWHNVATLALKLDLPALGLTAAARTRELAPKDSRGLRLFEQAVLGQEPARATAALDAARAADAASTDGDTFARVLLARALARADRRADAIAALQSALAEPRFTAASAQSELNAALAELR